MEREDRPYQAPAVSFLERHGGGCIVAATGAGKTFIAEEAAERLGWRRLLIVAPSSALYTWVNHFALVKPEASVTVLDASVPREKRKEIYKQAGSESHNAPQILAMTGRTLRSDAVALRNYKADRCIWDECQVLLNRRMGRVKTKLFSKAAVVLRDLKPIFLTANKRGQGAHELWSIFHLLDRKRFPSFWKFIKRFFLVDDSGYGREIVGLRRDSSADFYKLRDKYVYVIPEEEVAKYLPRKQRQRMTIPVNRKIARISRDLLHELYAEVGTDDINVIMAANDLVAKTRLRQLLTCPALVDPSLGVGDGLNYIIDHTEATEEDKIVIFSDFPSAFEWFEPHLRDRGFDEVYTISGATKPKDVHLIAQQFDAQPNGKRCALLASIPKSESYSIRTCRTGHMLGFSWEEDKNNQAEGRLQRGDKDWFNIFYWTHRNSVDEHVFLRMEDKRRFTAPAYN